MATTYDAQGEYLKDSRKNTTSGNIPASIMRQAQHHIVEALQNNIVVKASMHPGFSARVEKWATLSKDEKYNMAATFNDEDEAKAAMIMENDMDLVRMLSDRIDTIRQENAPKE